jgi:hypothetical protein
MSQRHYNYRQFNPLWLEAFWVTEDEIKLNRTGRMSAQQRRRVWRDRLPLIVSFVGLWIGAGWLYTAFRNEAADAPSTQCLGILLVLSLIMAIAVILRAWWIMSNLQVQVAVGVAQLEERTGQYGGLFLNIDGRNFELKRTQYELLKNGMALAVYYVTRRKRVLAIEPIVFHQPQ